MSKLKKSKFWILAGELSVDVGPLKSCLLQFIKFSCGADFAETSNKVNQRNDVEIKPQSTNHFHHQTTNPDVTIQMFLKIQENTK